LGWDGSLTMITNEIDKINYSSDQNWESNKKQKTFSKSIIIRKLNGLFYIWKVYLYNRNEALWAGCKEIPDSNHICCNIFNLYIYIHARW
jgi:hypothetical protein